MNIRILSTMLVVLSVSSLLCTTQDWEAYFVSHALMIQVQDETSGRERLVFFPLSTIQETNMREEEFCLLPLSKMLFEHEGVPVEQESRYTKDQDNSGVCTFRTVELINAGNSDQKMNMVVIGIQEFDKHYCFVLQPYLRVIAAKVIVSTRDPLTEQFQNSDDALFDQLEEEGIFDNHPGPKKISWFEGIKMKYGGSLVYYINNFCSYVSKKCHKWFL